MKTTVENTIARFTVSKKKRTLVRANNNDAIIYTRVSDASQANNYSLETQLKECTAFAEKNNLNIVDTFGGKVESAASDKERKEFQEMLTAAKSKKVRYILVYSVDRFSRTGDGAIWISSQLRKKGIYLQSVLSPVDASSSSGVFMQNMQLLMSQYDNDQRREKTVAGMRERLKKGLWIGHAPFGYKYEYNSDGTKKIVADQNTAAFVIQAFKWKANDTSLSITQIRAMLRGIGCNTNRITYKRLHYILTNPFYAGYVRSSIIEGELIKGVHNAIITPELFAAANDKKSRFVNSTWSKENENLPLRSFIRCEHCGTHYTGYLVNKKNLYYYRCNKRGCKRNMSANVMHESFKSILHHFVLPEKYVEAFRYVVRSLVADTEKENKQTLELTAKNLEEAKRKLDTIEERFATGEIDRAIYQKFAPGYRLQVDQLTEEQHKLTYAVSNLEKQLNKYIEFSRNLLNIWNNGNYQAKTKLQSFLFPNEIRFCNEKRMYLTDFINPLFLEIASINGGCKQIKTEYFTFDSEISRSVPRAGLEPACQ